jgi:FAD/FMN-containing dehydrogenase
LLALSSFDSNVISADNSTVQSGTGQGWVTVYSALEPYGIYAIGGRLKSIGAGGLTLGGGISYFSNKYGLTMDTVVAYEVILASGKVINATARLNADLFWALKGGGNNFGIVTKFTFSVHPIALVSTAEIIYEENQISNVCSAIADLAKFQSIDDVGGGFFTVIYAPTIAGLTIS